MKKLIILLALFFLVGCSLPAAKNIPKVEFETEGIMSAIDGDILVVSDIKILKIINLKSQSVVKEITLPKYGLSGLGVSNNIVVWSDSRNERKDIPNIESSNHDIFMYNIRKDEVNQITNNTSSQFNPQIWGKYVVCQDTRNHINNDKPEMDIYLYDIVTKKERRITQKSGFKSNPRIHNYKIVWEDGRNFKGNSSLQGVENVPQNNTDIYLYDIKINKEYPICTDKTNDLQPNIHNNYIVWESWDIKTVRSDIILFNFSDYTKRNITQDKYIQYNPKINGNSIIWIDTRRGSAANDLIINGKDPNSDVFIYDLGLNKEKRLTGDSVQVLPEITENWFCYSNIGRKKETVQVMSYK